MTESNNNLGNDLMGYEQLVQDAMRDVVRKALRRVEKRGFPGQHHFYIVFSPKAPGTKLSAHLRKKYPEEIAIVIQNQFWDLEVVENGFFVGLSFNGTPEKIFVPFSAIKKFFDPSASFGLQFSGLEENEDEHETKSNNDEDDDEDDDDDDDEDEEDDDEETYIIADDNNDNYANNTHTDEKNIREHIVSAFTKTSSKRRTTNAKDKDGNILKDPWKEGGQLIEQNEEENKVIDLDSFRRSIKNKDEE